MQRWVVNICPFLHFDNSRIQTYEHNISIVSWNVKSVLDYLDVDPSHKFCLDQVTLLEGFARLFPNYWDTLHQRVLEGRIEIVGGTYVMPDLIIPDGESIARQFLLGMRFFREQLGIDVRTGWAIDSGGHCSQMPQILRQCGIDSYFFWRGMLFDSPTEFVWKGPDGSRVNAVWLSEGFDSAAWLSENTREAFSKLFEIVEITGEKATSGNMFVPVGGELVPPLPHLADIVTHWNTTFADTKLVIVTPHEFTDKVKSVQSELPTLSGPLISGRFSGVRSGGLSARVKLKMMNRELEGLLYLTELYLSQAGIHNRNAELENIWRVLLFNQDHNLIRGTCTDQPYQLAVRRYKQGIENAGRIMDYALSEISGKVEKVSGGPSFVVLNPLPWKRSDIVDVTLDLSGFGSQFFEVHDSEGNSIPYQYEGIQDSPEIMLTILAENVPSLGHRTFTVVPVEKLPEFESSLRVGKNWIESSHLVVELDEFSGAISRIFDKHNQFEVLDSAGNYITFESEVGDLYRHADSKLSSGDSDLTSLRTTAKLEVLESGPVRTIFQVTGEMNSSSRVQTITVYDGVSRVDLTTQLVFKGRAKRVRLNFPLTVYSEEVVVGAQFANEKRRTIPSKSDGWIDSDDSSFPALDWVECMGPESGVSFSAPGLHEFEFSDGLLKVTLLRSVDHVSRGLDDDVLETKTAREIGDHTFRYTIYPFSMSTKEMEAWHHAAEHRLPLIAIAQKETTGELPSDQSFMEFVDCSLALSCFKPTDVSGEYIVRAYDVSGESSTVGIRFHKPIQSITLVDMCEKDIGDLRFEGDTAQLPVDGYSIITVKVRLAD